jgi:hypothetical protein
VASEMDKQLDSLPAAVKNWIDQCRTAWTRKDLPSGSSSHDLTDVPDAMHVNFGTCNSIFASQPSNGVAWTGVPLMLSADDSPEKKVCLDYITGQDPSVALFHVPVNAVRETLLNQLRVAKQCGQDSDKYTLVVLFSPCSLAVVGACVSSLFPEPTSTTLGAISFANADAATTTGAKPLADNMKLAYYCFVTGDQCTAGSPLQARAKYAHSLGMVVRPHRDNQSLNPLAAFNIWSKSLSHV